MALHQPQLAGTKASCQNCGHSSCLFHGEDQQPLYNGSHDVSCWVAASPMIPEKTIPATSN